MRGAQPLNYDASDNVGVRSAEAFGGGRQAVRRHVPARSQYPSRCSLSPCLS